jgi:hypothetical protein
MPQQCLVYVKDEKVADLLYKVAKWKLRIFALLISDDGCHNSNGNLQFIFQVACVDS